MNKIKLKSQWGYRDSQGKEHNSAVVEEEIEEDDPFIDLLKEMQKDESTTRNTDKAQ